MQLQDALLDVLRQLENLDSVQFDAIIFRLEQLASRIVRLCDVNLVDDTIQHDVTQAMHYLHRVEELQTENSFTVDIFQSSQRGRSCFNISREQMSYFLNHQFSIVDVAKALGVSQSTISHRMRTYGNFQQSQRQFSPPLSDEELDNKVRGILQEFLNAAYRRVMSQLAVAGLRPSQM